MPQKSLADAMNAKPGPDSLAYWLAPFQGYWDRQGRMAQQGLQMAEQGAQAVRGGDMGGLAGMILGPLGFIASPGSALFPERSEIDAATDVPDWSKPLIAGGLETMAIMAPGPKGLKLLGKAEEAAADAAEVEKLRARMRMFDDSASVPVKQMTPEQSARLQADAAAASAATPTKNYDIPPIEDFLPKTRGLGKGMAQLADDATDAERAALATRLEAEAAQTGGQATTVTRDQALRNLTEAPERSLIERIKAGWGDHAATQSWQGELNALSKDEVADLMRQLGYRPGSSKTNNVNAILGASAQAARDREMAERIRRGQ